MLLVSVALDDLHRDQRTVALAASYLLWPFGLRVSVGANSALVEATGTSTSLPSLMAYEAALGVTVRLGLRRAAGTLAATWLWPA